MRLTHFVLYVYYELFCKSSNGFWCAPASYKVDTLLSCASGGSLDLPSERLFVSGFSFTLGGTRK